MKKAHMSKVALDQLSHRDICNIAAHWLTQSTTHWVAGVEITTRRGVADAIATSRTFKEMLTLADYRAYAKASEEWMKEVSAWKKKRGARKPRPPAFGYRGGKKTVRNTSRITVVECKRTRSDLLADLKAKKMFLYEEFASHCYLCFLPSVLKTPEGNPGSKPWNEAALEELTGLGLTKKWGVCIVQPWGISVIRNARRVQKLDDLDVHLISEQISRKWMYRSLDRLINELPTGN